MLQYSNQGCIIIFLRWLDEFGNTRIEKIKYGLYIHEGADWQEAKEFWASQLNVASTLIRVYFKRSNSRPGRKNINKEYRGLVRICVNGSTDLARKIEGWAEGVVQHWGVV